MNPSLETYILTVLKMPSEGIKTELVTRLNNLSGLSGTPMSPMLTKWVQQKFGLSSVAAIQNWSAGKFSPDMLLRWNSVFPSEFQGGAIRADLYESLTGSGVVPVVLLLDAYPGAGAAYSVRKLSSTYTGAALRVRRSSDNTEQDIGFVGLDLDTSALSSFVGANNGFVTKWYDQSGNNKDFFQNTAASQLSIVNSGTIYTSNGIPAIRINNATTNSMTNSLSTLQNLPVSIFTCFELISLPTNVYNNFAAILTGNGTTDDYGRYEIGVSNNNYFGQRRINGSPFTNTNINDVTTNKRNIFAHLFLSNQINGYQNTNSYLGTAYSGSAYFNTSNFKIGKSNSTVIQNPLGHYQELIIYLSDQDSNNTGIRTNMNSYYSVY